MADEVETVLAESPPRHVVSISLEGGSGLVYLEPMVVGSEREPELEYLLDLGRRLADRFAEEDQTPHGR